MRRRLLTLVQFGLAGLVGASWAESVGSSAPRAVWSRAIPLPGIASLNHGLGAGVSWVSCGTPGNCVAGGEYRDDPKVSYHTSAFIVEQKNGRWGKAVEVPGLAALNTNNHGHIAEISCSSPGNCLVGGTYGTPRGLAAFVVEEKNGVWGNAIEVPGTAALNVGTPTEYADASVNSVSCATAGNCTVGGYYTDDKDGSQAFLADERNGVWSDAIAVPGTAALNEDGNARVDSVSCASPGNCVVGGSYEEGDPGNFQVFVADETNGVWGNAIEVPGTAALNRIGEADLSMVSCATAGNCAAGGYYAGKWRGGYSQQAFVVDERNGRWGRAIEVPGTQTLNRGHNAAVAAISCAAPGNCVAGGTYQPTESKERGFIVSETHGRWGGATAEAGWNVDSVSCPKAGNCTAGGDFVFEETNGHWGKPVTVHGKGKFRRVTLGVQSVSCAAPHACTAVGGTFAASSHRRR